MSYRRLIFLALLAGLPTMVWAQFTTFIPPQKNTKSTEPAKAVVVVARDTARTESIARMKLTDMKAWVDSAAGSVVPPATTPNPAEPAPTIPAPPTHDTASIGFVSRDSVLRLRHGTRAPATASDLPFFALIGSAALAVGTVLLAGTQLGRERA